MKPAVLLNFALSLVAAGAMALAGFSLRETYAANREIGVLQQQIVAISANKDRDESQDEKIKKLGDTQDKNSARFWKFVTWQFDVNNEVMLKIGKGNVKWPKMD